MTTDTLTRDEIEALTADMPGDAMFTHTTGNHSGTIECLYRGMIDKVADVYCGPSGPHALDITRLFAAAPALAATALHHMTENDRLQAELAEARLVLAAERGEAAGAVSEHWFYRPKITAWCRATMSSDALVWVQRWQDGWTWDIEGAHTEGQCSTARDAMRAADAALEATDGDD